MRKPGKRVVIVGVSASGKSTFARLLAQTCGGTVIPMDTLIWKPGWVYVGDDVVDARLHEIAAGDAWIIEGYITRRSRAYLFERADTILYLDYAPWVGALRYVKRWWLHRKNPRPEIPGCPEKFSLSFLKLVWTKGEALSLKPLLGEVADQSKLVVFKSPRQAKKYLQSIEK